VNTILGSALLATNDDWGHHHWWPLWLLFWAAVVGIGTWLILKRRHRRTDPLDRAREILAERYASGELSADEYRERLAELGARPA
jgi:putative membrane protein